MITADTLRTDAIREFCERHHIRKLALFGSHLHGDPGPDSDVDLLVEFDPEHIPGLLALASMERELARIVGKRVDMRTARDLSQYFREEVVREAKPVYVAAE